MDFLHFANVCRTRSVCVPAIMTCRPGGQDALASRSLLARVTLRSSARCHSPRSLSWPRWPLSEDVFEFPLPPALRELFVARAARLPALGLGDVPLGTATGVIYMGGRQRFLPLPVKKTHSSILRRGAWGQPIPFTHTLQCGGFRHLHCVANSAVSQRSGGSAPATA